MDTNTFSKLSKELLKIGVPIDTDLYSIVRFLDEQYYRKIQCWKQKRNG